MHKNRESSYGKDTGHMNKTLDNYLCEKYPRIFIERSKTVYEFCMGRGFECGNGFFPLINSLCCHIQEHIDSYNKYCKDKPPIEQMIFLQVKEKFSNLTIYYGGGDDYCRGLIDMTQALSYYFCEICGNGGCINVGQTKGWIQNICEECAKKSKRKIEFDKEITSMLKKAIRQDNKKVFDFYAPE